MKAFHLHHPGYWLPLGQNLSQISRPQHIPICEFFIFSNCKQFSNCELLTSQNCGWKNQKINLWPPGIFPYDTFILIFSNCVEFPICVLLIFSYCENFPICNFLIFFKLWEIFYLSPLDIFKLCGIPIPHQVMGGYQVKHCHQKTLHSNALIEIPVFITIIIVFIIIVILLHIIKIFYEILLIILPIIIILIETSVWLLREVLLSENNLLCCLSPGLSSSSSPSS